jgi:hypothetical protein
MSKATGSSEPQGRAGDAVEPARALPPVVDYLTSLATTGAIVAAAGLAVFTLVGGCPTHTRGATRSTRLEWERRQQAIEQAVQESASAQDERPEATADEQ